MNNMKNKNSYVLFKILHIDFISFNNLLSLQFLIVRKMSNASNTPITG